jgi:DNA ligase D-like protein (predicted ligase)
MKARIVDALPEGPEWFYEVKWDGYRALLIKNGPHVEIRSRNDNDLTRSYPGVAAAAARLNARSVVLDGELVAVDADGRPSFQALQHRSAHPQHTIVFYAFDVLHLDGRNVTRLPLEERRQPLPKVTKNSGVLVSYPLPGAAENVIAAVRNLGLEGVVAKRKDSVYDAGQRSNAWLKLKLEREQEFVIGGYRPGTHGVDALLVGYYRDAQLCFAGKVRAGFTPHLRRDVVAALKPLHARRCPFVDLPNSKTAHWGGGVTADEMQEMQWLKPVLVTQIRFVEWTADGHLRHAAFVALRQDKSAIEVTRES